MENTSINPEQHLQRSMEVKREEAELMWDMERFIERTLLNKESILPTISISKKMLGETESGIELDPQERLTMKPESFVDENSFNKKSIGWRVEKQNEKTRNVPTLTTEEITDDEIKNYKGILARAYRGVDRKIEKAWLFRNTDGKPAGWVAISEQGKGAHVGFIGVSLQSENVGYGSSILKYLKSKYESLSLTDLAYDNAGIGSLEATKRLKTFYAKNGFYVTSSGMEWTRSTPNIDIAKSVLVTTDVVAQATRYSKNKIMEAYLREMSKRQVFSEIFDEKETELIKSWLDLRQDYETLDNEAESYYRQIQKKKYSFENQ